MSSSAETFAVAQSPRASRVWKIVAVILVGLVAVPATLFVGSWAAGRVSDSTPATPSKVTTPTTVR